MESSSSTSSPRPFGEIISLWLKVFQMDEAFFAAEAPRASNNNTLLALIIYAVVWLIVGFIQRQFVSQLLNQRLFGNSPQVNFPVCLPIIMIVVVPLGYYIGIGLMHIGAMIFGGRGSFTTLAYLVSLFYIPLGIVSALLGFIPCVGGLISLAVAVFQIILSVRVLKVNYQLSTGRAVGAYFIPSAVIFIIIVPICVILVLAVMGPAVGSIFSNVIQNLQMPP